MILEKKYTASVSLSGAAGEIVFKEDKDQSLSVELLKAMRGYSAYELWLQRGGVGSLDDYLSFWSGTYAYIQTIASATWTVNHNLGFNPAVTVRNSGGVEVIADVVHTGINQILIYFDSPMSGAVTCS